MSGVPPEAIDLAVALASAGIKLLRAGDDTARQTEVLMEAQEILKAELDRRAFSPG